MNTILNTQTPLETKGHDVAFLVAILILMVLQFVIFYFGIPRLAGAWSKEDSSTSNFLERTHQTAGYIVT